MTDEQMIELIALAIKNVSGGENYDYMDFCRDAARAAHSVIAGKVAELEGHFKALERIIDENYVVTGEPDRVKVNGVWHDGPLATEYLKTLRVFRDFARAALAPYPDGSGAPTL